MKYILKVAINAFILCFFVVVFIAEINAQALFRNRIKIENGKQSIHLTCGEKRRLRVSSTFFGIPQYKGLRFFSSNKLVVTVDRNGIVHAGMTGKAYVSVVNSNGHTDSILIVVEKGGGKVSANFFAVIFVVLLFGLSLVAVMRKQIIKGKPSCFG